MTDTPFIKKRRQQFMSEQHYEKLKEFIVQSINEYDESKITKEDGLDESSYLARKAPAHNKIAQLYLEYTGGDAIEFLSSLLEEAIVLFEKANIYYQKWSKERDFKDYPLISLADSNEYEEVLQLIGLCYLLHRPDLLPRLARLCDGENYKYAGYDAVYEDFLVMAYDDKNLRFATDDIRHGKKYLPFSNALLSDTKEEALEELQTYMKKWYKNHDDLIWHDAHLDSETYIGYWAFEVAALVYLMDLDDSSLHKYIYYPKDMVEYARSITTDSDPKAEPEPVKPPPSRYTGYSVAVGEVCQETGYYECPRLKGRTVMLMQGQPVAGDKHNEMGAIIWYKLTKEAERDYLDNRKKDPLTGNWE